MSLLYLALTDGTTTLVLTDGINFTLENDGWYPALALDSEQRLAVDAIKINILGASTSGGASDPGRVRVNQVKLLTMLRQIQRGQEGDGGIVTLVYTSPNSSPARRIACQVTKWDPTGMMPDLNNEENLTQSEINGVTLTLEHRVPWVWSSYLYENLYTSSLWATTPTPAASLGTAAYSATTGYYGGGGLIRLTHGIDGDASLYLPALIAVTSGVPLTFTFSAGWTGGATNIAFRLVDSGSLTARSNTVSNATSGTVTMSQGRRFTATVTPTITGNTRMLWLITATNGSITEIAEVFEHATVAETWHLDSGLEGVATTTVTANFNTMTTMTIPASPSLAPTLAGASINTTIDWTSGLVVLAKTGAIQQFDLPFGALTAGFTSFNDSANYALTNNVLRYTPTVITEVLTIINGVAGSLYPGYIILAARNNSATTTFSVAIRANMGNGSANGIIRGTRLVTLAPQTRPYYINMGRMVLDPGDNSLVFSWQIGVTASAASGTCDFDWTAWVDDRADTNIITHGIQNNTDALTIDPRWLTKPTPTGVESADSLLLMTSAASLDAIWSIAGTTANWRPNPAAITTDGIVVTRSPAFDAPL